MGHLPPTISESSSINRICRWPVDDPDWHGRAPLSLQRCEAIEVLSQPDLCGCCAGLRCEELSPMLRPTGIVEIRFMDEVGLPLDSGQPADQPVAHIGPEAPRGVTRSFREVCVAMDDCHGVLYL